MSVNRACAVTGPGSPGLDPGWVCCWGGGGEVMAPFGAHPNFIKRRKKTSRMCVQFWPVLVLKSYPNLPPLFGNPGSAPDPCFSERKETLALERSKTGLVW